jgi:hypothetical protein
MQDITRNVMNAIKMNRLELLTLVQANKLKHIADFNESVVDYKALVLQYSAANLKLAKTASLDEFKKIKSLPASPVSYEASYARAIRMLELSVDEIIEVEEDVFNQLVLDEWSWKRSFVMANSTYKIGGAM